MALTAGTKLGPYEIQDKLGAGWDGRSLSRATLAGAAMWRVAKRRAALDAVPFLLTRETDRGA